MAESQPPLLVTERFRVEQVVRRTPAGDERTRAVVRHPGAVAIVPLVDDQHVCLIRNFRVSVDRQLLEIPAGTLEVGERPEETAARELIEETGYRAGRLTPLHSFYLSPGILDERMHVFVAHELEMVGAAREPGEEIENLVVPWDDALRLVATGQIEDAKTLCGLLLWDRLRASM